MRLSRGRHYARRRAVLHGLLEGQKVERVSRGCSDQVFTCLENHGLTIPMAQSLLEGKHKDQRARRVVNAFGQLIRDSSLDASRVNKIQMDLQCPGCIFHPYQVEDSLGVNFTYDMECDLESIPYSSELITRAMQDGAVLMPLFPLSLRYLIEATPWIDVNRWPVSEVVAKNSRSECRWTLIRKEPIEFNLNQGPLESFVPHGFNLLSAIDVLQSWLVVREWLRQPSLWKFKPDSSLPWRKNIIGAIVQSSDGSRKVDLVIDNAIWVADAGSYYGHIVVEYKPDLA